MTPGTTRPRTPDELFALDALLTADERDTATTVRAVLDEHVRPNVPRWYLDGTLPARDLAKLFGDLGLLGMHLAGYGCAGTTASMYGIACRELEAADGCVRLTEPDAGSDPSSMRTRARRDGGDWVLDGTKMWITNAPVADVAVVWARTDEGVRGFVVPTDSPGLTAPEVPGKLSLRASVTGQLVLDGVRLPADAVLPEVTGLRGPLSCLPEARFGIVWGATGALRDSLLTALEYASTRVQFGTPIAGFQLTQAKFADAAGAYTKAFLLAHHLGRVKDGTVPGARLSPEMISLGKLENVRSALEVARSMRTVLGGSGITADYSPLRHAVNLETVLTYEGTQEVHQLVVGKALTGLDAFGGAS